MWAFTRWRVRSWHCKEPAFGGAGGVYPAAVPLCGRGDKANFNKLFNNIFNALIVVVAPAVVGLFALSREVVLFISGESYLDAVMPLQILSLALIVCLFGWLYNSCALLPCGREKELF